MGEDVHSRARASGVRRTLRRETALTLVETMVAASLLLVGLLGTVKLIDVASSSQGDAKAGETATNLARELLEDAHSTPYKQIGSSGWITSSLASLSNDTGTTNTVTTPASSSAQTTLKRRGISYSASVSWCSADDSKDGYGSHSGSINWCADSTSTGSGDPQPEDLKRVTATITYSVNGSAKTLAETVTFAATGGMVAPSMQSLCPNGAPLGSACTPPYVITAGTGPQSFLGSAPGAADMKFTVNGVEVTSGVTNNNNGTWSFSWPFAALTDGNYTIGAIAVDALGNRSQPLTIQVKLARGAPLTVQNVVGGYNYVNPTGPSNGGTEVVELQWDAGSEGSITGYEVLRGAVSVCGDQTNLATSCVDASAPTAGGTVTTYTIKTWYQDSAGAAQSVTTTYSVTAPTTGTTTLPATYGVVNTWNYTSPYVGGYCDNKNVPPVDRDLVTNWPMSGGTDTSFSNSGIGMCIQTFTTPVSLSAGTATWKVWFTNTSTNKDCANANGGLWIYDADGTKAVQLALVSLPSPVLRNTTTPVLRTFSANITAHTVNAGQQLGVLQYITQSGTSCNNVAVHFGSGAYQTTLTLPPMTTSGGASSLQVPNSVGNLAVVANADGTRTVTWTPPASDSTHPAPDFYRVYRDGTALGNRVDTADSTNTSVATASSANATTLTVSNTAGFAAGNPVLVDSGTNQDAMTISSVNAASNTITFTTSMAHAHAVAAPVVLRTTGGVSWIDTNTGGNSHTYRVSAVSANLGESAFSPTTGVTG